MPETSPQTEAAKEPLRKAPDPLPQRATIEPDREAMGAGSGDRRPVKAIAEWYGRAMAPAMAFAAKYRQAMAPVEVVLERLAPVMALAERWGQAMAPVAEV